MRISAHDAPGSLSPSSGWAHGTSARGWPRGLNLSPLALKNMRPIHDPLIHLRHLRGYWTPAWPPVGLGGWRRKGETGAKFVTVGEGCFSVPPAGSGWRGLEVAVTRQLRVHSFRSFRFGSRERPQGRDVVARLSGCDPAARVRGLPRRCSSVCTGRCSPSSSGAAVPTLAVETGSSLSLDFSLRRLGGSSGCSPALRGLVYAGELLNANQVLNQAS